MMRYFFAFTALVVLVLTAPAEAGSGKSMEYGKTVAEIAAASDDYSTLTAALDAAGLVETLSGEGPFTVFAPTNDAFDKLPDGMLDSLLDPDNRDRLIEILTYHVLPGKVMSSDIMGKTLNAETIEGRSLSIDARSGVRVDDAKVISADIKASNGVIHGIDRVLMPK